MPLLPLGDSVLLEQSVESDSTSRGLSLWSSTSESSQEARVVATGPGRISGQGVPIPLEVKTGDRVLIRRYTGIEVEVEGREMLLVRASEILGRIT